MKALLLIAIVGVAATAMGIGFLNAPSIDVVAQDVGVGHTTLTAPVDTVMVKFHITASTQSDEFINKYDACIVKADETLANGATIICKLTDMSGNVVAEGRTVLAGGLEAGVFVTITGLDGITTGSLLVDNIADVTIVVQDGF